MATEIRLPSARSRWPWYDGLGRLGLAPALLFVLSCRPSLPGPAHSPQAEIRVAAASDLQGALPALTERFTAGTGIRVTPIVGASGQLAQQIRQGAPFDVFLSANMTFVRDLAREALIEPDSV